jgi:hypothetical protein
MAKQRETVLITGKPCLQARALFHLILEVEPDTDLVMVVLSKSLELVAALVDTCSPPAPARHCARGDAAAIDLGLSGPEYRDPPGG